MALSPCIKINLLNFTKLILIWYTGVMNKSNNSSKNFNLSHISTYQAGVVQSQAHRKLKKEVSSFLKPHGLTMMEWFALGLIKDSQDSGLRLTELSNQLQTTLPYTTNLTNNLMYKGFILRNSDRDDSRAIQLTLAPGIDKKCNEIEKDLRDRMRDLIYGSILPKDLSAYVKVLYQIANQR
jgi:DNA-binding MarR family transcriptional regulator